MSDISMTLGEFEDLQESNDYLTISEKLIGQGRWTTTYKIIFKLKDKYYKVHVTRGLTEYQDTDYDQDLEFVEVFPKQVVTTVYE